MSFGGFGRPTNCLEVVFVNGTARQRAVFEEAVARSLFFSEGDIPASVDVEWLADPAPEFHNEFAYTTNTLNEFGYTLADIKIKSDLDTRPGTYGGEDFLRETCHHELGHVVASKLTAAHIETLVQCFGETEVALWSEPAAWEDRIMESFCETFKDVYLPRAHRKFDNRTSRQLLQSKYADFLDVFDDLCCDEPILG